MPAALLLLAAVVAPQALQLRVDPEVQCPAATVREALERRFGAGKVVEGGPGHGEPSLRLRLGSGAGLVLELDEGRGSPSENRAFPRAGSCDDIAQTVALLAEAWLQQLPWKGQGILPGAEATLPSPHVIEPSRQVALPPAEAKTSPPAESRPPVAQPAKRAAVGGPPIPLVTVQLGGGGLLDGNAQEPGYFGTLALDVAISTRRQFGMGLEAELQSGLSASQAGGSLSVERQALHLFARYALDPVRGFRFAAGVGGDRLAAAASGFAQNNAVSVLDPELWLSASYRQPLGSRFYVFAQAGLIIELSREDFYIENADGAGHTDLLSLSPLWLTLDMGLGARLF